MKFTNVKQLIIKFMGGGLINFPTRFLRWIKIDGDAEDGDGGGSGDSGNLLMSLIPNNFPKPDLFLFQLLEQEPIDVTNYKIDDLINLADEEESKLYITCLYESSNLDAPIVGMVTFTHNSEISLVAHVAYQDISTNEVVYNNKTYYSYDEIAM